VGVGAESVVELPAGAAALASLLGDVADSDRTPGMLVAVVGGSGGVGASVLAVTLAEVTARHGHAVAVDLAPHGAGLDLLMGHEGPAPLDWDALAAGRGRMNSAALREAVARSRGAGVLGWRQGSRRELPQETVVAETLAAARRGHDLVVLDAPRRRHWPVCDAVVLVVGGSVHGVAAARRAVTDLPSGVPAGLAVRARRADTWGADVSRALGLPLWAVVPHQRGLDEHLSAGLGPARRRRSPLVRSARDLLTALDRLR
jgi:secretion/DNA translocation related CpaE-like protein